MRMHRPFLYIMKKKEVYHMKVMIASDIHGSACYCRKMLEAYEKERPEQLLILGDILYHGPRNDLPEEYDPKQVITMMNGLKDRITAVRGNCDCEVDDMVLDFDIMADYKLIHLDGTDVYMTHGNVYNQEKKIYGLKGILLCGHTHVPECVEHEDFVCMNPGSVSIPKNGTPHSYMIYEDGLFTWKDLLTQETYMEQRIKLHVFLQEQVMILIVLLMSSLMKEII